MKYPESKLLQTVELPDSLLQFTAHKTLTVALSDKIQITSSQILSDIRGNTKNVGVVINSI